jgi:Flp pilus assembly protein TadB
MFRCFRSTYGLLALAAAIGVGVYLVVWHGQHLASLLPVAVLLLCPLLHLLMHRHGSGHEHPRSDADGKRVP